MELLVNYYIKIYFLCYNIIRRVGEFMYQIALLFMNFMLFSLFGYIAEMTMCIIVDHKITNRGFLCGPIIPIYGVGSLFLTFLLEPFKSNPFIIFFFGIIITTTLEYITSYLLEKIFHNRWWDYSSNSFNINGRICLLNSSLFGIGSLAIIYLANPIFRDFLEQMNHVALIICAIILFIIFTFDVIYSCVVAYNLRNQIIIFSELKNEKLARLPGMLERMIKKRVKQIKRYPNRLLKAFPYLQKSNEKEFAIIKKIQEKKKTNLKYKKKKKSRKK